MDIPNIMKLLGAFQESRVLLTAAELNVFSHLSRDKLTVEELAARLKVQVRGLTSLLDALAAMGLVEKASGKYWCNETVATALSEDSPRSILSMALLYADLWKNWNGLTNIVKDGYHGNAGLGFTADQYPAFIGAMNALATPHAKTLAEEVFPESQLSDALPKSLLDVGAGSGIYSIAIMKRVHSLKATLLDSAQVIELAKPKLEAADVMKRSTLVVGDFYKDEFPQGFDIVLVSAIIHQNSIQQNRELYSKCFRALLPGGRIIIRDFVMDDTKTKPLEGAIFSVNMLVGSQGGASFTLKEISDDLEYCGFSKVRQISDHGNMCSVVEAFKL